MTKRNRLSAQEYIDGVLSGDRVILSRTITLIESELSEDIALADQVLEGTLPHAGNAIRIGITGVPGVGKSTFIEALGKLITHSSKKLAVLTIDPTSQRSGGSILGDKTRMETLARDPLAYIRPSATGSTLGGVANKTREAMLLCEAAGYEVIFVETVGVGQSEVTVKGMVDFFLLLVLAGAGDELQGIKKGIMEMANAIAITKTDGENVKAAYEAKAQYQSALHLFPPSESGWIPPVMTCSAYDGTGIEDIWSLIMKFKNQMTENGSFTRRREEQNIHWMHDSVLDILKSRFYKNETVNTSLSDLEKQVSEGMLSPVSAARKLYGLYRE